MSLSISSKFFNFVGKLLNISISFLLIDAHTTFYLSISKIEFVSGIVAKSIEYDKIGTWRMLDWSSDNELIVPS